MHENTHGPLCRHTHLSTLCQDSFGESSSQNSEQRINRSTSPVATPRTQATDSKIRSQSGATDCPFHVNTPTATPHTYGPSGGRLVRRSLAADWPSSRSGGPPGASLLHLLLPASSSGRRSGRQSRRRCRLWTGRPRTAPPRRCSDCGLRVLVLRHAGC